MFRAVVRASLTYWSVDIVNASGQRGTMTSMQQSDAQQLAAQINRGAESAEFNAAAIREAVRMERERCLGIVEQAKSNAAMWQTGMVLSAIENQIRGEHESEVRG